MMIRYYHEIYLAAQKREIQWLSGEEFISDDDNEFVTPPAHSKKQRKKLLRDDAPTGPRIKPAPRGSFRKGKGMLTVDAVHAVTVHPERKPPSHAWKIWM